MTALQHGTSGHGTSGWGPQTVLADDQQPAHGCCGPDGTLAATHESIASLLASGGQWQQAYQHLRTALELHHAEQQDTVRVPEQLRREVARLRRAHAEAQEQSLRDSLTDSYNRRYLDQRLLDLISGRAGRPAAGLAVALLDLDWFKQVNDTYGHQLGDRVLRCVAALLATGLPPGAFCARYGGEEFALVMPGMDGESAVQLCESARDRVERHPWHQLAPRLHVTISCGVAHDDPAAGQPDAGNQLPGYQVRGADILLYAAKRSGRNAVAYRRDGSVRLAGAAAGRRYVAQLPPPVTVPPDG